ncbi:hypothetical protein M9H77_12674 [Catharanthus roseus]|uniref:Uncharacterized protein n=1 Tax=Catharanthus roseus TaxID=4058 RepID=A0ACC0BI27_CATRO|nr:hypothetical protein M9H77_12674 [Catharanthus roseus]
MSSGAGHERGSRTKHTSGRGRLGGCGRGGSFGRGLAAVDIDFSSQNGGAGGWPHAANACDDGGIGSKSVPPIPVGTEPQSTLPDNPARGSSPAQPPLTSPTASPQLAGGPPLPGQIENTAGHLSSSQEDGVTSGDPNLPAGPASGGLHSSPGSVLLPAECSRL